MGGNINEQETLNLEMIENDNTDMKIDNISADKNEDEEKEVINEDIKENTETKDKKPNKSNNIEESIQQTYGVIFTVRKLSKKKVENSRIFCEACQRGFKYKSIKSHINSKLHKNNTASA